MLEAKNENIVDADYVKCLENQNAYMVSLFYAYQRIVMKRKKCMSILILKNTM